MMQTSNIIAADPKERVLAMSTLGRNGRFGNQVFQYAFLRIYAQRHGLDVRVPDWIGRTLFGHRDRPMGNLCLPLFHDQVGQATLLDQLKVPLLNVDVCGYFQYHTSWYAPSRRQFCDLFRPVPEIKAPLDAALEKLRSGGAGGRTIIGLHVRRGDFAGGMHYAAPAKWYLDWLDANWAKCKNPVLLLASDELSRVEGEFARYRPVTSGELGVAMPQASFYPDFYLLSQCDVLAISNSSFSFSAAMLNERASLFVRPSRAAEAMVPFDPWNSAPCLYEGSCDEQAAFYDRTYSEIAAAVGAYRADTIRPGAAEPLRKGRRLLANLWLGMNEDTLRIVYNTALSDAQRLLLAPELREVGQDADDRKFAKELLGQLEQAGLGGVWAVQYLLAAMLYCGAEEMRMEHDIAVLPQWLQADYLAYLRRVGHQAPLPAAK